jgi:hypothetical protein
MLTTYLACHANPIFVRCALLARLPAIIVCEILGNSICHRNLFRTPPHHLARRTGRIIIIVGI